MLITHMGKIIPLFKSVYNDYVKDAYISYMEMFEDCIEKKDTKHYLICNRLQLFIRRIIIMVIIKRFLLARELFTPNETICSRLWIRRKRKALFGQRYREMNWQVRETKAKKVNSLYELMSLLLI